MERTTRLLNQIAVGVGLCLVTLVVRAEPAKVALIVTEDAQLPVADVLAVELSKRPEVVLLERAEIKRILGEQRLTLATGSDYVRVGKLLAADGLLILEQQIQEGKDVLNARLVAVKPGVALASSAAPFPLQDPAAWSRILASQWAPLFPKLTVLAKDAVAMSVANFHSALNIEQEQLLEHELTVRLIHRLTQQRELFVLERQHMREIALETDDAPALNSGVFSAEWVLEGTLDPGGFDPSRATVTARLRGRENGQIVTLEVAGPRQEPGVVVDALAARVLGALHRSPTPAEWRPLEEAARFYEAAKWAARWGLFREAEEDCESAWALGNRTPELALLRIRSYAEDRWNDDWGAERRPQLSLNNPWVPTVPSASSAHYSVVRHQWLSRTVPPSSWSGST